MSICSRQVEWCGSILRLKSDVTATGHEEPCDGCMPLFGGEVERAAPIRLFKINVATSFNPLLLSRFPLRDASRSDKSGRIGCFAGYEILFLLTNLICFPSVHYLFALDLENFAFIRSFKSWVNG